MKWREYVWWSGGFSFYEMEGVCLMKWRSGEVERRGWTDRHEVGGGAVGLRTRTHCLITTPTNECARSVKKGEKKLVSKAIGLRAHSIEVLDV